MTRNCFWALLLLMMVQAVAAEDVFKCRSKAGQIIYSNVPCDKQNAAPQGAVEIASRPQGSSLQPPGVVETARRDVPAVGMIGDGQVPYINGYIGRSPVRFMVDTISIPHKRAIELGIPVFAGQRAESMTASGKVGIYKIRLESVTVGNVTVRNVAAHVSLTEAGSQEVLLGMSFLRYVNLSMRNGIVNISP